MAAAYSDEDYEKAIDHLNQWFMEHEYLPKKVERILLERFYCMYNKDVNETKINIKIAYQTRNTYDNIFIHRDPTDDDSRRVFGYADMVPLPGLTPENYHITCFRILNPDQNNMKHIEDAKALLMIEDCRLSMPDITEGGKTSILSEGEIQIFDMVHFSLRNHTFLPTENLYVYYNLLIRTCPVRVKAMHMINCPPYLDNMLTWVKPRVSKEVWSLMHFHKCCISSLHEHVPRDMLPEEYGGKAGKLADLKKEFMQIMLEKRDYIMDRDYWFYSRSP